MLGDKILDEITNPRLFRLKQRTLLWCFSIYHMPGNSNYFSDATSRHPATSNDELSSITLTETLAAFRISETEPDEMEDMIATNSRIDNIRAITWDIIKKATSNDDLMLQLINLIKQGFPTSNDKLPPHLRTFWDHRNNLHTNDNVVLFNNRVVVPSCLRQEVLQSLHAAHQGVSAMNERAKMSVFWLGISKDIQITRNNCLHCIQNAPSQARLPPYEPWIPSSPFESVVCDYFAPLSCCS